MRKKNSVAILNEYIKAYEKKMKADEQLNEVKKDVVKYVLENGNKLEYKKYKMTVQYSTTYNYSSLASEIKEALAKQKKIEELNGDAIIKTITPYIKLIKDK